MTTIAWDGKTLAADRRVSYNSISDASRTKISKTDKGLCGAAGTSSIAAAFQRWFIAGEEGEVPPLAKDGEQATGFIIRPDGRRFMYDSYGYYEVDCGPFALGTGYEIALGAMTAGCDAVGAVAAAAKYDGFTSWEVDSLEL